MDSLKAISLVIALSVPSVPAIAADQFIYSAHDPSCQSGTGDRFEPSSKILIGPFKGQCIENNTKRALVILKQTNGGFDVANFRSEGRFYRTVIPFDAIEKAYYQWVDLKSGVANALGAKIAHTHLRLKLKNPLVLLPQVAGQEAAAKPVTEVIASFNYTAPAGVGYSPVKGFNSDYYGGVFQIYDIADEIRNRFVKDKLNVYQVELSLREEQKLILLDHIVRRSNNMQYGPRYNTWTASCTTFILDVIDGMLGRSEEARFSNRLSDPFRGLVAPVRQALLARGVLKEETPIESVNEEFGFDKF